MSIVTPYDSFNLFLMIGWGPCFCGVTSPFEPIEPHSIKTWIEPAVYDIHVLNPVDFTIPGLIITMVY